MRVYSWTEKDDVCTEKLWAVDIEKISYIYEKKDYLCIYMQGMNQQAFYVNEEPAKSDIVRLFTKRKVKKNKKTVVSATLQIPQGSE